MEKILVLNGSFCETPVIKRLKEKGYFVITTGNAPELEGHQYSDEYIKADYSDKEEILKLVKDNNISGIVGCANDFGTITASYVAEKMHWKGHDSYENTLLLHHKDRFKEYCSSHRIPSVKSVVFDDIDKLLAYTRNCKYPIIVKANDLTGGKGIQRADNYDQAVEAATKAFDQSRDKRVLVEPFIIGTQHAVDAFIANGKVVATASCNCYSNVNPYLIQTETYPSDHEEDVEPICNIIIDMAKDLKLEDGVFTVQYIRDDSQFYIIEVMRRLTGNLSFTLYEKSTGFPWYEGYIRTSLGMDCSDLEVDEKKKQYCGHHGIFARQNGIIVDYKIPDDVMPHVYESVELIKRGSKIDNYKLQRISSFFYTYADREEMETAAKSFYERIVVEMKED